MSSRAVPSIAISALIILSGSMLVLVAGCNSHKTETKSPVKAPTVAATPPVAIKADSKLVGNKACAECHANEFKSHRLTRHSQTMRTATRTRMGNLTPASGLFPGSDCGFAESDGKLYVATTAKTANGMELNLALGSGKTGITFISVVDSNTVFEMGSSYFPKAKKWRVTPGHEEHTEQYYMGQDLTGEPARKCIQCHAVTSGEKVEIPSPEFQGVGCESCHGAGSLHIADIKTGKTSNTHMEKLGGIGAEKLNSLCGTCHRTASDVRNLVKSFAQTAKHQPYGLMKSECFKQSGNSLSCLSCHDPHTDTNQNIKHYEAACLRCHDAGQQASTSKNAGLVYGRPCKVNPRSGCIPCHMPKREILSGGDVGVTMADHFIRSYKPSAQ